MKPEWKKGLGVLAAFEMQNLFLYYFYKQKMFLFRHLFYYVVISHCLLLLVLAAGKIRFWKNRFFQGLFFALLVSADFFSYGIIFGNLSDRNINTTAYFVNYLYFFCLAASAMVLWRGVKAIWISGILTAAAALLNYHIYQFRGSVLNLMDIYSWKTAWNVKGNYRFLWNAQTVLFLAGITVSMIVFSCICRLTRTDDALHFQWILFPVMAILLYTVHSEAFLQACQVSAIYYEPGNNNGYYYNTVLKYLEQRRALKNPPEGYDVAELERKMSRYTGESEQGQTIQKPNVVVIMNESFSDFSAIREKADFEQDLMQNLQWIREESVWGNVSVSVFGGNTANSEYEFLTGDSMMYYPAGSVPYSVYITQPTEALPSYFNQLGYYTCAVHPYLASGWNRPAVYACMGFQETMFLDDFEDAECVRGYVSDAADYEKVFEVLEKQEEPVFCFNVTMQNHGGYEETDGLAGEISLDGLAAETVPQAETYLSLTGLSDSAIGGFIKRLKDFEEPTVVVFFGDHQPGVEDEFYDYLYGTDVSELTLSERLGQYTTPFFIWSNEGLTSCRVDQISLNYLSALMLTYADLPLTAYHEFLLEELYPEYPVVTEAGIVDKNGEIYTEEEPDSPLLLEYRQLIYNHIMDHDQSLEDVFSINGTGGLP